MKQFSLEEYLKDPSREIITRDGRKVRRILCTDARSTYPVIALVEDHIGTNDKALSFTKDGKFFIETDDVTDLFFAPGAPEKHEGWINIYKFSRESSAYHGSTIWSTEEEAKGAANSNLAATIKIEWEE